MKYLLILLLSGCAYNDICPQRRMIELQLRKEYATLRQLGRQPLSSDVAEQIVEEEEIIESLEIDKLLLNCK